MAERALTNTDKRIKEGKGVIPAFLFSCLLWDPVREDAHNLLDQGNPASKAWRIAMMDALRDQSQYVSVPKRMADTVIEIWTLHFRLVSRKPKTVFQIMNNRRFRAAYDFMLLRANLSEVDQDLVDWWTTIQEVDEAARQQMVDDLLQPDDDDDGEPNFNSIEYSPENNQRNHNGSNKKNNRNQYRGRRQGGSNSNNRNYQGRQGHKRKRHGGSANQSADGNQGGNFNSQGSTGQQTHADQVNSNSQKTKVSRTSRSNPYRSRRKSLNRKKKEDSYF